MKAKQQSYSESIELHRQYAWQLSSLVAEEDNHVDHDNHFDHHVHEVGENPTASSIVASNGWDGPGQGSVTLNYHIGQIPTHLNAQQVESAIEFALSVWSDVVDINFVRTNIPNQARSLDINFEALDGAGGTLAQAYFPDDVNPSRIAGDITFDLAESWEFGNARGSAAFDFNHVAVHEIGHALGLSHSDDPNSVLAPSVSPNQQFTGLSNSDIAAARQLYAPASPTPDPPPVDPQPPVAPEPPLNPQPPTSQPPDPTGTPTDPDPRPEPDPTTPPDRYAFPDLNLPDRLSRFLRLAKSLRRLFIQSFFDRTPSRWQWQTFPSQRTWFGRTRTPSVFGAGRSTFRAFSFSPSRWPRFGTRSEVDLSNRFSSGRRFLTESRIDLVLNPSRSNPSRGQTPFSRTPRGLVFEQVGNLNQANTQSRDVLMGGNIAKSEHRFDLLQRSSDFFTS